LKIVSVDIETTGTDPSRHEAWEIAVVPLEGIQGRRPEKRCYQIPVTLVGSQYEALKVGDFYGRYTWPRPDAAHRIWDSGTTTQESLDGAFAWIFRELKDAQLLGCSVHFDAAFISELFRRHGFPAMPWHHRHLDLGSFAGGAWGAKHALSSKAMADRYPNEDAHNALADAEWNVEVYRQITGTA